MLLMLIFFSEWFHSDYNKNCQQEKIRVKSVKNNKSASMDVSYSQSNSLLYKMNNNYQQVRQGRLPRRYLAHHSDHQVIAELQFSSSPSASKPFLLFSSRMVQSLQFLLHWELLLLDISSNGLDCTDPLELWSFGQELFHWQLITHSIKEPHKETNLSENSKWGRDRLAVRVSQGDLKSE